MRKKLGVVALMLSGMTGASFRARRLLQPPLLRPRSGNHYYRQNDRDWNRHQRREWKEREREERREREWRGQNREWRQNERQERRFDRPSLLFRLPALRDRSRPIQAR